MLLPTVGGDRLSGLKEFKLKRCLDHLGFVMNLDKASWACSVDNRDQSKTANTSPSMTTQSNAVTPDDDSNPAPNNHTTTRFFILPSSPVERMHNSLRNKWTGTGRHVKSGTRPRLFSPASKSMVV
jgi:hypothetical protein